MILHKGERVYWGAPEVIYLEGTIRAFDEKTQTVLVSIERATPHSAHLIGNEVSFAANGLMPLKGASPPGTINQRSATRLPPPTLSNDEKIQRAAAVAVHQQYGYQLPAEQEHQLIELVALEINNNADMRTRIISSMDEILRREF